MKMISTFFEPEAGCGFGDGLSSDGLLGRAAGGRGDAGICCSDMVTNKLY